MASLQGINFLNILFMFAVHRKSEEHGCPAAKGKVFRQFRCLSGESLGYKMCSVQSANVGQQFVIKVGGPVMTQSGLKTQKEFTNMSSE
jgi:hypothetical protein